MQLGSTSGGLEIGKGWRSASGLGGITGYSVTQKVSGNLVFTQNQTKLHQISCGHKLDVSLTSIHAVENYHIWKL